LTLRNAEKPAPAVTGNGLRGFDLAGEQITPTHITVAATRNGLREAVWHEWPDSIGIAECCFRYVEKSLRRDPRFRSLPALEMDLLLADARRDLADELEELMQETCRAIISGARSEPQQDCLGLDVAPR
jgi:hypothetical protein